MPNCTCQHCNKSFVYKAKDVRFQPPCHRFVVGDCTCAPDVARAMGGQKATLMATDPPYLVDYQGGNVLPEPFADAAVQRSASSLMTLGRAATPAPLEKEPVPGEKTFPKTGVDSFS